MGPVTLEAQMDAFEKYTKDDSYVFFAVFEYNQAGINAYKKAGFKEIGRRREIKYLNGKLWDDIYMDCLATEFTSKVLDQILDLKSYE
jgi:RimJ/RimL family protein N-acetyltransferase